MFAEREICCSHGGDNEFPHREVSRIYQRSGGNYDLLLQGRSEYGGCGFSENAAKFLPSYMVTHSTKDNSSSS